MVRGGPRGPRAPNPKIKSYFDTKTAKGHYNNLMYHNKFLWKHQKDGWVFSRSNQSRHVRRMKKAILGLARGLRRTRLTRRRK